MEDLAPLSPHIAIESATAKSRVLAQTVAEQRRRIREFLASQRHRMDDVESQIAESLGRIIDEVVRERAEAAGNLEDLQSRTALLEKESQQIADMRSELEAARSDWDKSRHEAEQQQNLFLEQLRLELKQIPQNQACENGESSGDEEEREDYKQRYEMSLEDIRSLREENELLKEELEQLRSCSQVRMPGQGALPADASLSWEAQKQRILASLEEDFDEDKPEDVQQRLSMEELVRTTDRALAERDEEISELKELLQQQSENISGKTVDASVVEEIIDKDEIIQQERQRLEQIQEEMREKLRAAEINISVERAKIAREKAELEEKLRQLSQRIPAGESDITLSSDNQEKPARGRWLSRLGLNELDR